MKLDLHSPEWNSLPDAGGATHRVPALLQRLQKQDPGVVDELCSKTFRTRIDSLSQYRQFVR